jgi:hypothetical protein
MILLLGRMNGMVFRTELPCPELDHYYSKPAVPTLMKKRFTTVEFSCFPKMVLALCCVRHWRPDNR